MPGCLSDDAISRTRTTQDYPGLPRTTLRYDLFDTPYVQYLVFVAGPRMFTRSLMASGAGASTLN